VPIPTVTVATSPMAAATATMTAPMGAADARGSRLSVASARGTVDLGSIKRGDAEVVVLQATAEAIDRPSQ
jgi:hypothetical protein